MHYIMFVIFMSIYDVTFHIVQEATVLNFDPSSKLIQVEYSEETLTKLKCSKDEGKFTTQLMSIQLQYRH